MWWNNFNGMLAYVCYALCVVFAYVNVKIRFEWHQKLLETVIMAIISRELNNCYKMPTCSAKWCILLPYFFDGRLVIFIERKCKLILINVIFSLTLIRTKSKLQFSPSLPPRLRPPVTILATWYLYLYLYILSVLFVISLV